MSFKDQMLADQAVFFNVGEFAELATLTTIDGLDSQIKIIRGGSAELAMISIGQGNTDNFTAQISEYAQPSPQDQILIDGVTWIVQPGFYRQDLTWSIPVQSDGRIRA